tara:strand:- start:1863 stop:3308 length:1446 start_codon:yes stop_codon:yes gene_type:complete
MRVVVKNLKLLPNGKYQYRRVWPQDVRQALPELGRELKRTFEASVARDGAIVRSVALERQFDHTVRKIRENQGQLPPWEITQRVQAWYNENKGDFETVLHESVDYDPYGDEVRFTETAADLEMERILAAAAKRSGLDRGGNPLELSAEERLRLEILNKGSLTPPPLNVEQAFALYTEKKKAGRVDRSAKAAAEQFVEFNGNVPLNTIRSARVMDWLDHLVDEKSHGYETVKKRLGAMKAIVNFAKKRGAYEGNNPFVGHQPPDHAKATLDRLPFHRVHLDALDSYLAASRVQDETRWVIALLRNTGCRPSEIGGLKGEDLSLDGAIPFALVRWSEDRRLKTNDSERRVPLLGNALEAARSAQKRHATGWLFPSLAPSSGKSNDNQAISARINSVIRAAGVARSPQLVCYSFRHTMAAALDQTPDLAHAVRERALGRKRAQYGARELPLEETFDALSRAIPLLGKVDEVLYDPQLLKVGEKE